MCLHTLPQPPSSEASEPRHPVTLSGNLHGGTSCLYFCMLSDLWLSSDGPLIPDALLADGAEPTQEEPSAIFSVGVAMTWQDTQMSP